MWKIVPAIAAAFLLSSGIPAAPPTTHANGAKPLTFLDPAEAPFKPVPGAMECISMTSLRGDLSKGPATFMTRMTPGCVAPWHWHTPTEEIAMLRGSAIAQMREGTPVNLGEGAYSQLPGHHQHRFRCTSKRDCVIITIADAAFDIHWVDQKGEEIPLKKALAISKMDGW